MAVQAGKAVADAAEQAQPNKQGFQALCTEIRETSECIAAILKNIEYKVELYPVGTYVRTALHDPECKEYADLSKRISSFESRLKVVDKEADVLISRSWWRRWLSASEDASTLTSLQSKIAKAYQQFQFDGSVHMEQMLTRVVDEIIEAETSQVLDALSPGLLPRNVVPTPCLLGTLVTVLRCTIDDILPLAGYLATTME